MLSPPISFWHHTLSEPVFFCLSILVALPPSTPPSLFIYLTRLLPLAGYEWNRSSPLRSSPDTSSSMYPDRPIRPLPSRSLRARLSPEQAETIVYPQNPPPTGPLFNFPYMADERVRPHRTGTNDHHACHCGHTHSEVESEEEEDDRNGPLPASPSFQYSRHPSGKPAAGATGAYRKPGSPSSSVDGYESFENTNNKKKRKIPNMGSNGSHHATLSADLASMGVAHAQEAGTTDDVEGDGVARYYGSAPSTPQHNTNSGTGISGAGRGRFGRSGSGRSERRALATSSTLANAKANSKRTVSPREIIRLYYFVEKKSPCADQFVF